MNARQLVQMAALSAMACAGVAVAQPTVDGKLSPAEASLYGMPLAVQGSSVIDFEAAPRVRLTAQSDQSNIGGKGVYAIAGTQSAPNESDPALVTSGIEVAIRLADLPGGGPGVGGFIKVAGFISGGSFLSNQVIGGLSGDPENLGNDSRNINFETQHAGKQYIAISTTTRSPTPPVIDGRRDSNAAETAAYGARSPQTDVGTGFGSNSVNPPSKITGNGSEICGSYGYIYDNGTPGNPNDDILVLFIAGNLEPNFNRLNLFIDCASGGQNTISRDNSGQGFNLLVRWGENADGTNPEAPGDIGPGLTFDSDFFANMWVSINHGNTPTPNSRDAFVDSAVMLSSGVGAGTFFGGTIVDVPGSPASGILAGSVPANPDALTFDIDNTNNVNSPAPNNGGLGGRANLPGGGSQMDVSDPATVTTGVEFKINLDGIGYPGGAGTIKLAGIITGFNWDFMSNQAIGGLTSMGSPDPFNLGFPAKDLDFNDWDGDQFVEIAVPASPTAQPAGAAIDGRINTNAGELSRYGSPLWVNTIPMSNANASGFGDSPGPADVDQSTGSEINAVYAYVALDPTNSNKPTLYVCVTGNLHDFNKLMLFLDTDPGEGQNDLRGDNAAVGNFNGGVGGPDGLTFDAGFTANYAVIYEIGFNSDTAQAEHTAYGLQLLTGGGGFGGVFASGPKSGVSNPLTGEIVARVGFGNNDFPPLNTGSPDFFDRSVVANGSELNAVYLHVDTVSGVAYFFVAGNLETNLTSLEMFFDTVNGGGQNTLIFDSRSPQDPLYTGNPDVDFGALNRMGGPVIDPDTMMVLNAGLTFDSGFAPDYYMSFRTGNFLSLGPIPGDGIAEIYGNYARLRTLADPVGPMPSDAARFLGIVFNDTFGGPAGFINGDQPEPVNAIAIDNANLGGVGGGQSFLCLDGTETDPATVKTGIEIAIDLADINWDGVSPMKFKVFINGPGHGNISNQVLNFVCSNDLGEPRDVNFNNIQGNQFISYPIPVAAPDPCRLNGDANGDGFVDFNDITSVLANWLGAGPLGDANGDGAVDFNDITTILANWLASAPCN